MRKTLQSTVSDADVLHDTFAIPLEPDLYADHIGLAMISGRLGLFVLDLATGIMDCTAQCRTNFGWPPDTALDYATFVSMIHEADRSHVLDAVEEALSQHTEYKAQYRITTPHSETRWIVARGRAIYDQNGTAVKVIGVTQDITEQQETLNALRASEETVRERERRLRVLYELTSRTDMAYSDKVDQLLSTCREWLGMETAILANVDCEAGVYQVAHVIPANGALTAGFACSIEDTFCSMTIEQNVNDPPMTVEHAARNERCRDLLAHTGFGFESCIAAVVRAGGRIWGTLAFLSTVPRHEPFTKFDSDIVRLAAQWVGSEIARQEAVDALRATAIRQRRFVREMLLIVTEGRLRLCDSAAELPEAVPPAFEEVALTVDTLHLLRRQITVAGEILSLTTDRVQDLMTAAGEASMNAVKHGGGGQGSIRIDRDGESVMVWIVDQGKGIREEDLHRATLEKGWSGAGSLGHGFYLMLRTADRVYLLTGPEGTTVVLEMRRTPPPPAWFEHAGV
jgi:PAS domain S-box-containing protein